MRHCFRTLAAWAVIAALVRASASAGQPGYMKIGTRKLPTAINVKMDVLAPGDLEPMSATIREKRGSVVLQIVQGGNTAVKAVEVDHGRCPNPGRSQYRLPAFRGNQYQAVITHAKLADVLDGKHALAIFSSNRRRRTTYACGDLNPPNALQH